MDERVSHPALWSRAVLVGVVTCFLGVAGHVTADGLLPSWPVLLAVGAGSVLLGVPLLVRRASRTRLAALLVAGQTMIHLALSLTAGHAGDPAARPGARRAPGTVLDASRLTGGGGRRVGSLQDAYVDPAAGAATTPALPVGHLVEDLSAHAPMMVAHLVAAALVGLWLAQGERHLWAVVDLLARVVVPVLPADLPVARPASAYVVPALALVGFRSLWLALPRSRRGPPLLLVNT